MIAQGEREDNPGSRQVSSPIQERPNRSVYAKGDRHKPQATVAKGKEVLEGHGSTGDYPNQTRANRVEDIPFARALGSIPRGEEVYSEKGVIGVTLAHHEPA